MAIQQNNINKLKKDTNLIASADNKAFITEIKNHMEESLVIDAFEKDNAFESIYLNSREQIMSVQSKIGQDPFIKKLNLLTRTYNNDNPVEKVFLHLDKSHANPGVGPSSVSFGDFLYFSEMYVSFARAVFACKFKMANPE